MADVKNLTESVIKQIMEGVDPRAAIDAALDEKAGYHKEKRIRDGKAQTVNVKNTKRKVHHVLTADQKKAIKKAHSAAANKKRAKSLKKGNKMGLYKEGMEIMSEEEEQVIGLTLNCPACGEGALEIFDDPESENEGIILVCPNCGETFVVCSTAELEDEKDDDDDEDEKDDEEKAEEEAPEEEAPAEEAPAEEEAPQDEAVEAPACDGNCDGEVCDGEPEEETGLFFAAE